MLGSNVTIALLTIGALAVVIVTWRRLKREETLAELMLRHRVERMREKPMRQLPSWLAYLMGEEPAKVQMLPPTGRSLLCGDCGLSDVTVNGRCASCGSATTWVPAGEGRIIKYDEKPGFRYLKAPSAVI